MHYGDQKIIDKNKVELIVYKHKNITGKRAGCECEVTSIQSCKYFPPKLLASIINNINDYLDKELAAEIDEQYYRVILKIVDDKKTIETIHISNVTNCKNKFYFLH